mgnify:CR=1 FL=1
MAVPLDRLEARLRAAASAVAAARADLLLVTKCDLLPHLDFDVDALVANARRVRPGIAVIRVSARSGEGMQAWLDWLAAARTVRGLSA